MFAVSLEMEGGPFAQGIRQGTNEKESFGNCPYTKFYKGTKEASWVEDLKEKIRGKEIIMNRLLSLLWGQHNCVWPAQCVKILYHQYET